jgi:hypothetical protein
MYKFSCISVYKRPDSGSHLEPKHVALTKLIKLRLISFTNINAQFFYSLTICMLHYNPRHVSSINMLIFRRTNCILTASGIVALCKRLHITPVKSGVLCSRLQRATIPDAVRIQFVLLKMSMLMLETCRG